MFLNKTVEINLGSSGKRVDKKNVLIDIFRALTVAVAVLGPMKSLQAQEHSMPVSGKTQTEQGTSTQVDTDTKPYLFDAYYRFSGLEQHTLGARFQSAPSDEPRLNLFTLRDDIHFMYNNNTQRNKYLTDFEKNFLGEKKADDAGKLGVPNLNWMYRWKIMAVGVNANQGTFTSAFDSDLYPTLGYSFYSARERLTFAGIQGGAFYGNRGFAFGGKFSLQTSLPMESGQSFTSHTREAVDLEALWRWKENRTPVPMWIKVGLGLTGSFLHQSKAPDANADAPVTRDQLLNETVNFSRNTDIIYPEGSREYSFNPYMDLQGVGRNPWQFTLRGSVGQESGEYIKDPLRAQEFRMDNWRVGVEFRKPINYMFTPFFFGGIGNQNFILRTKADYAAQLLAASGGSTEIDPALLNALDDSKRVTESSEIRRYIGMGVDSYFLDDRSLKLTVGVMHVLDPRSNQWGDPNNFPKWNFPHPRDTTSVYARLNWQYDFSKARPVKPAEVSSIARDVAGQQLAVLNHIRDILGEDNRLAEMRRDLERSTPQLLSSSEMAYVISKINKIATMSDSDNAYSRRALGIRNSQAQNLLDELDELKRYLDEAKNKGVPAASRYDEKITIEGREMSSREHLAQAIQKLAARFGYEE